MQSSLNMMIKQFTGHSNKNHALLLRHRVESLTLETKLNDSYKKFDGRVEGMVLVKILSCFYFLKWHVICDKISFENQPRIHLNDSVSLKVSIKEVSNLIDAFS